MLLPNLKSITLIPINGLGNRLQAIASLLNAIHSRTLKCSINWPVEVGMGVEGKRLFSSTFLQDFNLKEFDLSQVSSIPVGITSSSHGRVFLRGGLRGEQHYLSEFYNERTLQECEELVVIAGGFFDINNLVLHTNSIRENYSLVSFSDEVTQPVNELIANYENGFCSLHLRYKDRSHQAVDIHKVVKHFLSIELNDSLMLFGDDLNKIEYFYKKTHANWPNGCIFFRDLKPDRNSPNGIIQAGREFLLLSKSNFIFRNSPSSFSEEASFFSTPKGVPLITLRK